MLTHGANPFVVDYKDETQQEIENLQLKPRYLNMPRSIYHVVDPFQCQCTRQPCSHFLTPFQPAWYYATGVFDGKFKRVVGRGGEGVVVEGMMCGAAVVFKFVIVKKRKVTFLISDTLTELRKRLNEARQYDGTQSELVVPFYGHYR